jgi:hypothetical protein
MHLIRLNVCNSGLWNGASILCDAEAGIHARIIASTFNASTNTTNATTNVTTDATANATTERMDPHHTL